MSIGFPSTSAYSAASFALPKDLKLGSHPEFPNRVARGNHEFRSAPIEARTTQFELDQQVAFDLNLTTADGDQVTISYDYERALSSSSDTISSRSLRASSQEFVDQSRSQFTLQVQGDLNEQEKSEINQLLGQVESTVSGFLNSEEGAFVQHALTLGADPSVISAYSLGLTVQESVTATTTYQEIASPQFQLKSNPQSGLVKSTNQGLLDSLAELGKLHKGLVEAAQSKFDQQDSINLVGTAVPFFLGT